MADEDKTDEEIAEHVVAQYGAEKMREFLHKARQFIASGLPWETINRAVRYCDNTEEATREWLESYLALIEKALAEKDGEGTSAN